MIKKASMLAEMHLRNVRQKLMLKKRTEEAVQRLQVPESFVLPIIQMIKS